jgi:hypothetical protein
MHLNINPRLEIQLVRPAEDVTVAVIDDFLLNPADAVAFAAARSEAFEPQQRAYPGRILPVPNEPLTAANRFIQRELSRLFPFCRGDIRFHAQFSLTTLRPEKFSWVQRLPHSDPRLAPGRANYAALLYLFEDPELGGTGFYRWKDPAYWERMTALQRENPEAGLDELRERFEMFRQPACYVTESNEAVELVDHAPARFNRLIFYSGEIPHSAHITHPQRLTDDPRTGRLTLNWFVDAVPRT